MAILNGKQIDIGGLNGLEISEILLAASSNGDGKGISLVLTSDEIEAIKAITTMSVENRLQEMLVDAIQRKTGKRSDWIPCTFEGGVFKT